MKSAKNCWLPIPESLRPGMTRVRGVLESAGLEATFYDKARESDDRMWNRRARAKAAGRHDCGPE
jgi:hypothetical protein